MFIPRHAHTHPHWLDGDGIKLYSLSVSSEPVDQAPFHSRLAQVKAAKAVAWSETPAFAIYHQGARFRYLILAWWGNDNELFTSVSVQTDEGWVEDPARFSFCLYDLEIFWAERNIYIETLYCDRPDIASYRHRRAPTP